MLTEVLFLQTKYLVVEGREMIAHPNQVLGIHKEDAISFEREGAVVICENNYKPVTKKTSKKTKGKKAKRVTDANDTKAKAKHSTDELHATPKRSKKLPKDRLDKRRRSTNVTTKKRRKKTRKSNR